MRKTKSGNLLASIKTSARIKILNDTGIDLKAKEVKKIVSKNNNNKKGNK